MVSFSLFSLSLTLARLNLLLGPSTGRHCGVHLHEHSMRTDRLHAIKVLEGPVEEGKVK